MSPSAVRIRFFGVFSLEIDGSPVQGLPKPAQEILAFLALEGNRGADRRELATAVWPEADSERAEFYLRRALSQIRTALGPYQQRLLSGGERRLSLDLEGVDSDLDVLKAKTETQDAEAMVDLVDHTNGVFLLGRRSNWVERTRDFLKRKLLNALVDFAERLETAGNLSMAERCLKGATRLDPLREETACRLMCLQRESGNFPGIQHTYQQLSQTLRQEVGLSPSPKVGDLYRKLLSEARLVAPSRETVVARPTPPPWPTESTPFFGREAEVERLQEALRLYRLVTLSGLGGVGKSRLAQHVAQQEEESAFVSLSGTVTRDDVYEAAYRALGVSDLSLTSIGQRSGVLLLDEAERVLQPVAELVECLLQRSRLTVLCTSRIPLQLGSEHVVSLGPLGLPSTSKDSGSEAVQFFLKTAKRTAPGLRLDGSEPGVLELCSRLDGHPLALELAAVRLRSLPLREIVANLDDRFRILDRKTAEPSRRDTLQGVLDWSFQLLSEPEQRAFVRLAVFPAPWGLEAAQAVLVAAEPEELEVPLLLSHFVEHSLLAYDFEMETYRMLETVRSFALQRLQQDQTRAGESFASHAEHYLAQAATSSESVKSGRFQADAVNYSAALNWFLGRHDLRAIQLVNRLFPWWYAEFQVSEGLTTALRVLDAFSEVDNDSVLETVFRAAGAAHWLYQMELSDSLFQRAEEGADARGLATWSAESKRGRGEIAANEGRLDEAKQLLQEALQRFLDLNDRIGQAKCLGMLGYVARRQGQFSEAVQLTEAALAIHISENDTEGHLWCLGSLAAAHIAAGEPAAAAPRLRENLELQRAAGNVPAQVWNLTSLGEALTKLGQYQEAEERFQEALNMHGTDPNDHRRAWPLIELGEMYRVSGRTQQAQKVIGQSIDLCRKGGAVSLEVRARLALAKIARDSGDLSSARAHKAAAEEGLARIQEPELKEQWDLFAAEF